MFDLGIVETSILTVFPGGEQIQIIEMRSGEWAIVYWGRTIHWMPGKLRKSPFHTFETGGES